MPQTLLVSDKIGKRSGRGRFWVDAQIFKLEGSARSWEYELEAERVDFGHNQLTGIFKVPRVDYLLTR